MAKGNQHTTIYPKGVSFKTKTGKFIAQYLNKDLNRTIYIGSYNTIDEAVTARSNYIRDVFDGIIDETLPKIKGLPKGIRETSSGKFVANIQYWYGKNKEKNHKCHIGTYETIEEAVEARVKFIKNLF